VVALWLQGSNDYRSNGRRFMLGPGEGILMEPNAESHIVSSADRDMISIRIPAELLLLHARGLIARPDQKPLEATGPIPFDSLFWRKADYLIGELERANDESIFRRAPGAALHLQFDLINHIVLSTPNSYQALLEEEKTHPSVHRLRCRLLEEYMDAHLLERFSPEKMALVAGVGWSSVQRSFHIHYGKPPEQVFREKQLDRARLDLLTRPETTVAAVARRYAFSRLYRFRAYYSQYHGESPEETRNQGRGWLG
jgi:AraC-like DNA-binding protein